MLCRLHKLAKIKGILIEFHSIDPRDMLENRDIQVKKEFHFIREQLPLTNRTNLIHFAGIF